MIKFRSITPEEDKNNVEVFFGFHSTPFGKCFIGMTAEGICHLSFSDYSESLSIETLRKEWQQAQLKEDIQNTEAMICNIFEKDDRN